MGLQPLEFSDCLTDSPYFREKLHTHEKELERTSKAIKGLVSECKELLTAARNLSKAQRTLSHTLTHFEFKCIGSEQTDDERIIGDALKEFGKLISVIEDERDRMLDQAFNQVIGQLEKFRKQQIGCAKEGKKKFDKQTSKFCQSLERYLGRKTKNSEDQLAEADAAVDMERKHFYQASMQYVLLLQEVQERKKFEFVETLLTFTYSWLTFYHQGHEVSGEFRPYMTDLQVRLQKCRANFDTTKEEAEHLMNKMLEVRGTKPQDHPAHKHTCTREGYLFVMEKKIVGTTSWTKYYCQYQKENKILTMIPYNQVTGKGVSGITTETFMLTRCVRRASDSIDKRFCFDITVQDKNAPITLQALSEDDRKLWLDAMDGKEPIYHEPSKPNDVDSILLDDVGFCFINKCIAALEGRALDEQGLYRIVGVNSRVNRLTSMGLDRRKADKLELDDPENWEIKTITSALKNYFRSLPEPLLTYKLHYAFITAAKQEAPTLRRNDIHDLVHQLPEPNREMLDLLIAHLQRIAQNCDKNLMTVANLGVCFGPTLMRTVEETMAAIMDIKWCNLVVEILIENYEKIFKSPPDPHHVTNTELLDVTGRNAILGTTRSTGVPSSSTSSPSPFSHSTPMNNSQNASTGFTARIPFADGGYSPPVNNNHHQGSSYGTPEPQQTYAAYRAKLRPVGIYSQYSDQHSSASSSTESLNSKCSHQSNNSSSTTATTASTPQAGDGLRKYSATAYGGGGQVAQAVSRFSQAPSSSPPLSGVHSRPEPPGSSGGGGGPFNFFRKRRSADSINVSISSSTSSISSVSSGQHQGQKTGRKVRTLYACEAENETELSFEPNQILHNVRQSREPGWLEGVLGGRTGLIPANYVEYLN